MLVALTGGFGTGKSTVLEMFRECGARVLSADSIVHELLGREDVKEKIRERFGSYVFNSDGSINRKALAERVFSSDVQRRWIENLLHPEVFKKIEEFYSDSPGGITIVEIPLLYETSTEDRFDAVIVVYAPESEVRKRLQSRGFTEAEINRRIKAQLDIEEKKRRADYIVDNSLEPYKTRQMVVSIFNKLKEMA